MGLETAADRPGSIHVHSEEVPLIWDLRTSLRDVLNGLREPAPEEDKANVPQTRAMLLPRAQTLLKDFDPHRCDGSDPG